MAKTPSVLVLGLGNVLWADDGFGVRAVEALRHRYRFPDQVALMDGGTQGFGLLRPVQTAEVQALSVAEFGGGLTAAKRRQPEPALGMVLAYLQRFGITPLRPLAAGRPR